MCQKKKDMHIWIEHIKAHNPELQAAEGARKQKIYPYIARMRLQGSSNSCLPCGKRLSISELDSNWLKRSSYTGTPGEVALTFSCEL